MHIIIRINVMPNEIERISKRFKISKAIKGNLINENNINSLSNLIEKESTIKDNIIKRFMKWRMNIEEINIETKSTAVIMINMDTKDKVEAEKGKIIEGKNSTKIVKIMTEVSIEISIGESM